jgi:RNA polymerase sigma factor (sigma-70 family)
MISIRNRSRQARSHRSNAGQLDLFGFGGDAAGMVAETVERIEVVEAVTAAAIAAEPALAAAVADPDTRENLDLACLLRAHDTPQETIQQTLERTAGPVMASVTMEQLAAVERAQQLTANALNINQAPRVTVRRRRWSVEAPRPESEAAATATNPAEAGSADTAQVQRTGRVFVVRQQPAQATAEPAVPTAPAAERPATSVANAQRAPLAKHPAPLQPSQDLAAEGELAEDAVDEDLGVDLGLEGHDGEDDLDADEANAGADDTRGASALTLYMRTLSGSRFQPPSVEQETELGRLSMAGDIRARNELVERNLRFMITIARRFMKTGRPFDELLQAGSEGLMRAAEKFNPDMGRFTTIAVWWIRQRIQRMVQADSNMPLPMYLVGREQRLLREAEAASTAHEREALQAKAAQAARAMEARRHGTISLDAPAGSDEDGATTLMSMLAAEELSHEERMENQRIVKKIVELAGRLGDPRLTRIFLLRAGLHPDFPGESLSLSEISEEVHYSRERVRQLYNEAAEDIATAMEFWAKGPDNLPPGFRRALLSPGRTVS